MNYREQLSRGSSVTQSLAQKIVGKGEGIHVPLNALHILGLGTFARSYENLGETSDIYQVGRDKPDYTKRHMASVQDFQGV